MGGNKKPAPAPDADNGALDNNKRLAFLEGGVSSLALALAAAGIELKDDQDPIEQAKAIVDHWRADTLALAEAVVEAGGPQEGESPRAAAIRLLTAKAEVPSTSEQSAADGKTIAALQAENATLQEDLDKANAALATAGKKGAKASPRAKSVKARKCVPMPRDKEAIAAVMASGEPLELVVSDGRNEIIEFAPFDVTAAAFARNSRGWLLTVPVEVKGASSAQRIRGFGLFAAGKQVAFSPLAGADEIGPGMSRGYSSQIAF